MSYPPPPSTIDGLHRRKVSKSNQNKFIKKQFKNFNYPNSNSNPNPTSSDFFIKSLPGQPVNSTLILFAGHLSFSPLDSKLDPNLDSYGYFFLNKARHIANRPVLMIWLNGGPGCSSFDGSLMEIGPLRLVLKSNGKLREAHAAWNEYVNLLFIDQPTGTGYSFGPQENYQHELNSSSSNLINFLSRFFKIFPEYQNMDLYLAGESFAGQYIPYLAQAILETKSITAPLKGLIIGNGWVDPVNQYLAYADFSFQVGLLQPSSSAGQSTLDEVKKCQEFINSVDPEQLPIHMTACEGILSTITASTIQTVNSQKMCLNMYDVRLVDTYPACGMGWPPDLADIAPYLSKPEVKKALHAERHTDEWEECNSRVGNNFWVKTSRPSITLFPKLLEKTKILLYSGDQDLICCHLGTERMIGNLTWGGHKGWVSAESDLPWNVNGTYAGRWREERNLTYVLIANASHMAPYDVPDVTQDMLLRFLEISAMSAAGPAAQIPSRVGVERPTTLNVVSLNDSHLVVTSLDPASSSSAITLKNVKEDNYIASSAILLLILVAAGVGLTCWIRNGLKKSWKRNFEDGETIIIKDHMGQTTHQESNNKHKMDFIPVSTEDDQSSAGEGDEHELNDLYHDNSNGELGNKTKSF
ncbi:hypothetical protein O181_008983 [Austropuccinia psidii MF-1]|uniref:Pheromone-processing carboxypeptidase KEX1 n=1 Tax=Austropuccinia psidii MF-1 TaxID=1389203 RepID=A0A9Q3GJ10_9BASI|nr:hypothetical protein [Austropuccinia psidii MF-1]